MSLLLARSVFPVIVFGLGQLHAAVTVYTDKSGFDSAIATTGAAPAGVDFESYGDGAIIAPLPQSAGDLTFESFSTPGFDLIVESDLGATSGDNYLRVTSDGGVSSEKFGFDDNLTLSFAQPSNALGLYLIVDNTSFDFFPGDINIAVNGATYGNDGSETATTVNGVAALFFGVVDDSASFTTASIFIGDIGTGLGDFDDISYSVVPEPSNLAFTMVAGALGLMLSRRRALRR